jgi:urease accessory protein
LRVQKPLYPEGPDVCQVVIVHPPGGIVTGDSLAIDVDAHAGAHVQLTTPGAAKWYRSPGPPARLDTSMRVHAGALVEWLPQETLLFEGAHAEIRARVELADGARFIGWEVTGLGRTASGERFGSGRVRQTLELLLGNVPLWCERAALDGGSRALQSGPILNGRPVFGTLVAAGAPVGDDVLAACRALRCASGDGAVTRLPQVLVARYLGASGSAARAYFAGLWSLLRPAFAGREAVPPRIWNT